MHCIDEGSQALEASALPVNEELASSAVPALKAEKARTVTAENQNQTDPSNLSGDVKDSGIQMQLQNQVNGTLP